MAVSMGAHVISRFEFWQSKEDGQKSMRCHYYAIYGVVSWSGLLRADA